MTATLDGATVSLTDVVVSALLTCKSLGGVFRDDASLVTELRNGVPLGPRLRPDIDDCRGSIAAALTDGVAARVEPSRVLVFAGDPGDFEAATALSCPSAALAIARNGSTFSITLLVEKDICPDGRFLQHALGSVCHTLDGRRRDGEVDAEPFDVTNAASELFVSRLRRVTGAEPHRPAIIGRGAEITYASLAALSDGLADHMCRRGACVGDRVFIVANRSPELVVSVVAALKCGMAFSIADEKFPDEYIGVCADVVAPAFVVDFSDRFVPLNPSWKHRYVRPTLRDFRLMRGGRQFDADVLAHDDLSTITFTSGTTGGSKAVAGRYGSLTDYVDWMSGRFGPFAGLRFGMCSNLAHDPLQRDILTPLYCGGTICVPADEDITAHHRLQDWMAKSRVEAVCLTPALVAFLSESGPLLPDLAATFFVGASLRKHQVLTLRRVAPNAKIVNMFGTTESQRAVSFFEVPAATEELERLPEMMPIGRGMKDVDLIIWDAARGVRCGPYALGEIVIRSRNVALGYLNDAGRSERFRMHLLGVDDTTPAYLTGDLGYYSFEHGAHYVGRNDLQGKVHGHRVSPEEISTACRRFAGVQDAITLVAGTEQSPRLVTFLVPQEPFIRFDPGAFRAHLSTRLPAYMVPSQIETVPEFPLTPNGKVDLRRLHDIAGRCATETVGSRPDRVAAFAYKFVLQRVGRDDFDSRSSLAELGIDSIQFVELVAALTDGFGSPPPREILSNRLTIDAVAALFDANRSAQLGSSVALSPDLVLPTATTFITSTRIDVDGRTVDHLCSNSYLGLADDEALRAELAEFVMRQPTLGSHGSLLVNGYTDQHDQLDCALQKLYGSEAATLYGSGYLANLSVIAALVGPGDRIFIDEQSHRSLREGCALSGAIVTTYAHNDPLDLAVRLRSARGSSEQRLIVTEAVFGIEGDIADLPALSGLAKAHDAVLLVDEASSLGQLGASGRGIEEHYDMAGAIDVRTGSLAKAIPSSGGFAACARRIANGLRGKRAAAFSTGISPLQAFLAERAIHMLLRDGGMLVDRLRTNIACWRGGLQSMGFDIGRSMTAITRIAVQDEASVSRLFASFLEHGVYALPITSAWTTSAFGLRTTVTAAHGQSQLTSALERLRRVPHERSA